MQGILPAKCKLSILPNPRNTTYLRKPLCTKKLEESYRGRTRKGFCSHCCLKAIHKQCLLYDYSAATRTNLCTLHRFSQCGASLPLSFALQILAASTTIRSPTSSCIHNQLVAVLKAFRKFSMHSHANLHLQSGYALFQSHTVSVLNLTVLP